MKLARLVKSTRLDLAREYAKGISFIPIVISGGSVARGLGAIYSPEGRRVKKRGCSGDHIRPRRIKRCAGETVPDETERNVSGNLPHNDEIIAGYDVQYTADVYAICAIV